jgi:hypothetical protein
MMQLLHHYQNTDGPYTCVPGKDQFTYCKGASENMQRVGGGKLFGVQPNARAGIYGLGNSTGPNGKFSTHIDGFIMDRYPRPS